MVVRGEKFGPLNESGEEVSESQSEASLTEVDFVGVEVRFSTSLDTSKEKSMVISCEDSSHSLS